MTWFIAWKMQFSATITAEEHKGIVWCLIFKAGHGHGCNQFHIKGNQNRLEIWHIWIGIDKIISWLLRDDIECVVKKAENRF